MTVIADSSVVVTVLLQRGPDSLWAEELLGTEAIAAPSILHAEVAGVLRRRTLAGEISDLGATTSYARLLAMPVELHEYGPYAARIWELRHTVIIKDAWFVALAEALDVPLATLDRRLTRAPGPRCRFLTPPTV